MARPPGLEPGTLGFEAPPARRAPQSAGRAQAFSAIVSSCCSSSVVSLRKSHAADVVAATGSAVSRSSAVFNYTDTAVTDNDKGLLNDRRLAEFAYALPRTRWNIGLTQQVGRVSLLARVNYFGGWYDYDSGFAQIYLPSGGIEQGFFAGQPIVDLEASIGLGGGTTLAVGSQNAFNTFPDESARARSVGEKYSEYTPWGFNGAYYYARLNYGWDR